MPHLARNRATPPPQSCSPHCCLPLFPTACFFGPQGKCRLKLDWITTDGLRSVALHGTHPYVLLRLTAQGIRQKRQHSYCRIPPPVAAVKLLDASICGNSKYVADKKAAATQRAMSVRCQGNVGQACSVRRWKTTKERRRFDTVDQSSLKEQNREARPFQTPCFRRKLRRISRHLPARQADRPDTVEHRRLTSTNGRQR